MIVNKMMRFNKNSKTQRFTRLLIGSDNMDVEESSQPEAGKPQLSLN
jgi:hypothetical protein